MSRALSIPFERVLNYTLHCITRLAVVGIMAFIRHQVTKMANQIVIRVQGEHQGIVHGSFLLNVGPFV